MQVSYRKMQGAGNRIVVVDQRVGNLPPPEASDIRRLGDPRTGPGFDQLMWVGPASDERFDASYRVFNADGSEVEQCGNGVRCVARTVAEGSDRRRFVFDSRAGAIEACLLDDGRIAVNMGAPVFDPARIPFIADTESDIYALNVAGRVFEVSVLSMGNPHCILDVDDVRTADVDELGPVIETHDRFPAGTNVGFRHIVDRATIELRVHERGVGETAACGTGACAALVAARRRNLVDAQAVVRLPGGQLVVKWRGKGEPVWLTGDAEFLGEGIIEL